MMLITSLHRSSGLLISNQIVRHRLHEDNHRSRKPLRVAPTEPRNQRAYLQSACDHRNWAEKDWRYV